MRGNDTSDRTIHRRAVLMTLASGGTLSLAGCAADEGQSGQTVTTATGTDTDTETNAATAAEATTTGDETTGVTAAEEEPSELRVAVTVPLSGDLAFFGQNIVPATQYVAKEINDNGGIAGADVRVMPADTELNTDTAVSLAQKAINVDKVHGIIGNTASTLFSILDLIQENGVPYFAATSSGDLVPIGGQYVYMVFPSDLIAGSALGLAASQESYNQVQSFDKMGVLAASEGLYTSFLDPLQNTFESQGGTITDVVEFAGGKSSYQAEAQRVVGTDPDIIALLAGPTDSVKLMRAAFNAGYDGQWLGAEDTSTAEFLNQAPAELTDGMLAVISTSPSYVDDALKADLAEKFQQFSEREYGLGAWLAYDAMTVIGLSMKQAAVNGKSVTRANIAANIPTIGNPPGEQVTSYTEGMTVLEDGGEVDFQGVRSNCNFDDRGNVTTPYNVIQVQDGEWSVVSQISAENITTE